MLATAEISAVIYSGLTIRLRNGRRARLAILDGSSQIVDDSPAVAREVWNVSIAAYKSFLVRTGQLRTHKKPPPGISGTTRMIA